MGIPELIWICSHCSKETEEEIHPSPRCMESISTTHHDYRAMGFQSTPQPITQVQAADIPPRQLTAASRVAARLNVSC